MFEVGSWAWRVTHRRQIKRGIEGAERYMGELYACAIGLVAGWADGGAPDLSDLSGRAIDEAAELLKEMGPQTHDELRRVFARRRDG